MGALKAVDADPIAVVTNADVATECLQSRLGCLELVRQSPELILLQETVSEYLLSCRRRFLTPKCCAIVSPVIRRRPDKSPVKASLVCKIFYFVFERCHELLSVYVFETPLSFLRVDHLQHVL